MNDKPLASIGELLNFQLAGEALSETKVPGFLLPLLGTDGPDKETEAHPEILNFEDVPPANTGTPKLTQKFSPILPETRSGKFNYSVDQGLLLYGENSDNVLLDGQVLPFCDYLLGYRHRPDICYLRSHVLMQAQGGNLGRPVFEDDAGIVGQKRLHAGSYLATSWASSSLGFWGKDYMEKHAPFWHYIQPLESLGNWTVFEDHSPQHAHGVLPYFLVKSKTQQGVQMVDVSTRSVDWFEPLDYFSPLAAAFPLNLLLDQIQEMEIRMWQKCLFSKVYVGMEAVGPAKWKIGLGRPGKLDVTTDYSECLRQPAKLNILAGLLNKFGLSVGTFFSTCNSSVLRELLNGPAVCMGERLLNRSGFPGQPIMSRAA